MPEKIRCYLLLHIATTMYCRKNAHFNLLTTDCWLDSLKIWKNCCCWPLTADMKLLTAHMKSLTADMKLLTADLKSICLAFPQNIRTDRLQKYDPENEITCAIKKIHVTNIPHITANLHQYSTFWNQQYSTSPETPNRGTSLERIWMPSIRS